MIRVTCDTCEKPIDRDEDRWFGVDLTEPPKPSAETHPDPVQAMYDAETELSSTITLKANFNGDHERHFCSAGCLSSWAFGRGMEETT